MNNDDRYMTVSEAMDAMTCTEVWVHVLKKDGTLRSRVGEVDGRVRRLILRSDVQGYLDGTRKRKAVKE